MLIGTLSHLTYPVLLLVMILNGTTVPKVGETYAIHPYSIEYEGASTAVTVQDTFVSMRSWDQSLNQKWKCVENNGWLGFICYVSPASYLGYDTYSKENLVRKEQKQQRNSEDFQVVKHDQGCAWEMSPAVWNSSTSKYEDQHQLAYVSIVKDSTTLKLSSDCTNWWGFTKWTEVVK